MGRMTSRIKTKIMFETTNQQYDPISKVSTRREGDFSKHLWTIDLGKLPSGKRLQFANLKIAIEIVDLPMIFHCFFVCLPEGTFPSAHPQQERVDEQA
jgi:hypothetical protein